MDSVKFNEPHLPVGTAWAKDENCKSFRARQVIVAVEFGKLANFLVRFGFGWVELSACM